MPSVRNDGGGRRANILRERCKSKVSLHQRKIFEIYGPLGPPYGGTTLSAYIRRWVRIPPGPQNLKKLNMFKKKVYVDEKQGFPEILKGVIGLLLIIMAFIVAFKIGDWTAEQDTEPQYSEVVEVH